MIDEMLLKWANDQRVGELSHLGKLVDKEFKKLPECLQTLTVVNWGMNDTIYEKAKMTKLTLEQYQDYVEKLRLLFARRVLCS